MHRTSIKPSSTLEVAEGTQESDPLHDVEGISLTTNALNADSGEINTANNLELDESPFDKYIIHHLNRTHDLITRCTFCCCCGRYDAPLRYEVDVSRIVLSQTYELNLTASDRGCFSWALKLRVKAEDSMSIEDGERVPVKPTLTSAVTATGLEVRGTDAELECLLTGTAVQLTCLKSNSLMWSPSAVTPSMGDRRALCRLSSEVLLHEKASPVSTSASSIHSAEASGALLSHASPKGIFVIEHPSEGNLNEPSEIVLWGKPYRFRHMLSGAYLTINMTTSPKSLCMTLKAPHPDTEDDCDIDGGDDHANDDIQQETTTSFDSASTLFCLVAGPGAAHTMDDCVRVNSAVGWIQGYEADDVQCKPLYFHDSRTRTFATNDVEELNLKPMIPTTLDPAASKLPKWVPDIFHRREMISNFGLELTSCKSPNDLFHVTVNNTYLHSN
jgi:hypothetical protein